MGRVESFDINISNVDSNVIKNNKQLCDRMLLTIASPYHRDSYIEHWEIIKENPLGFVNLTLSYLHTKEAFNFLDIVKFMSSCVAPFELKNWNYNLGDFTPSNFRNGVISDFTLGSLDLIIGDRLSDFCYYMWAKYLRENVNVLLEIIEDFVSNDYPFSLNAFERLNTSFKGRTRHESFYDVVIKAMLTTDYSVIDISKLVPSEIVYQWLRKI
jgi:hypothetical protein